VTGIWDSEGNNVTGIWHEQIIANKAKAIQQLKIRAWVSLAFTVLDFVAAFIAVTWFVRDTANGDSLWWTFLAFALSILLLGWLFRDAARFLVVSKAFRDARGMK
jgi:hypothetical protein